MRVDSYSFGKIVIDGKSYSSDVIAYRGEVDPTWWRKAGHELNIEDLDEILSFNPKAIIVGTGHDGCMKVPPATEKFLKDKNIYLIVKKTKDACEYLNALHDQNDIVFAAHLTC